VSGPGQPRQPVRRGPNAGPRPGRPKGRELPALATFTLRAVRSVETRMDSAFPTLRGERLFEGTKERRGEPRSWANGPVGIILTSSLRHFATLKHRAFRAMGKIVPTPFSRAERLCSSPVFEPHDRRLTSGPAGLMALLSWRGPERIMGQALSYIIFSS